MTSRPFAILADEDEDDGEGGGGEVAKRGIYNPQPQSHPDSSSLAAKAIRASSAHRDSSLSSAYGHSSRSPKPTPTSSSPSASLQVCFFHFLCRRF